MFYILARHSLVVFTLVSCQGVNFRRILKNAFRHQAVPRARLVRGGDKKKTLSINRGLFGFSDPEGIVKAPQAETGRLLRLRKKKKGESHLTESRELPRRLSKLMRYARKKL
ncbi:hypothetical protein AVEN_269488-1 [Araneus ventricosus]|uniref:Uncharacterized protein n=1 Tax=Araneus ventricosus TaxID=182803 RepID=A0A4Y2MT53_ARAVE|nr:hypothetical protein AVEN_269488-1 [Araneus ventricosus]